MLLIKLPTDRHKVFNPAEALDRAATGIRRAIDASGPDAVGFFSCSKATNEVNYVAQKWARMVMASNNIDSCNRT